MAYLLLVGVLRFGAEFQPGGPIWRGYATQSLTLLVIVLPVLLFGRVLKPKSLRGKKPPSHKTASRGSTTSWFDDRSAAEFLNEIDGIDWRAKYAFEIEKILSIQAPKRKRFLLALHSAGIVILGFLTQFFYSLTVASCHERRLGCLLVAVKSQENSEGGAWVAEGLGGLLASKAILATLRRRLGRFAGENPGNRTDLTEPMTQYPLRRKGCSTMRCADQRMSRTSTLRRLLGAATIALCALACAREGGAASLVVDAESGAVLSADASNHLWYPASLTKMMTVYVALSEIKADRLSFDDMLTVSARAANVAPVRFGLAAGQEITVRQAINATIVASGNDAATALAEKIGGTEEKFANIMTLSARGLGMTRTIFRNASGLPDNDQVTTAHDMAILAIALLKTHPQHYELFNQRSVTIGKRSRGTVNGILGSYQGADGIKTGFTCGSGYNLVVSAMRDGRRVIGVVLGSTSRSERSAVMTKLLDKAFARDVAEELPLAEMVMAAANEGAPPVVLSSNVCAASSGTSEDLVRKTARAGEWGIVFGSFAEKSKAQKVLAGAKRQLGSIGGQGVVAPKIYNGVKQWSAMILGLSQKAAGKACKTLWAKDQYCLALRPAVLGNEDMTWR